MRDDDLRAYARRPWRTAEALKQANWTRELAENPLATFEASQALWVHMRQINPDWPTDAERQEDLAHHILLKHLIDRAAGVFLTASGHVGDMPVVSAGDLVVMKILAGRSRDMEDVASIVRAQPDLDVDAIRDTLRLLERALDRADLVAELERVIAGRGGAGPRA
jgi:hypothetical protein